MKTIHMRRADWEKWDTALRSGEYKQGQSVMHYEQQNTFCCLGVLQHCLTGSVEPNLDEELPTPAWLATHGITFYETSYDNSPYTICDPLLPSIDKMASEANDETVLVNDDQYRAHVYNFVAIADAIKDTVEFTDEVPA